MDNNYTEEEIAAEADILISKLGLTVDRRSTVWLALKLGITKGIGMGVDRATEIIDAAQAKRQAVRFGG